MTGSEVYTADKGQWDGSETASKGDQKRLEDIRKQFDYAVRAWKDIRDEAENDERALSTSGPWLETEREERNKNQRPCLHLDQLNQYVVSLVNEVRNNPIAINVEPAGGEANDETSELRANRIRQIEYESNAQQAYQTAFESTARHSYGVIGVTIDYKSWDDFQRVIKIRRFVNSDSVLWDPDAKEADFGDMQFAFVLSRVRREDFKRLYPDAGISDFGSAEISLASAWVDDQSVQVAEYWHIEKKRRTLYKCETPEGVQNIFRDKLEGAKTRKDRDYKFLILKDGTEWRILDERKTDQPFVKQCVTNGVEILDEMDPDWPGKEIPIIPVVGPERFVRSGNKVRRVIESRVRLARDGQQLFDYYVTTEAEIIGMTPKIPWLGYEGQFDTQTPWNDLHKVPRAYAEVKATTEEVPSQLLPLPQRQGYEPPVEALEIGKESVRRSIQATVASYGVTRLDDTNVKSGVALKQLEKQNDLGSYHFIDNYKIALRRVGRILNDLLDDVEGGEEELQVGIRKQDDSHEVVNINGPDGQKYRLSDKDQHQVTISTGASFQTQREEAATVADSLIANIQQLPLTPPQAAKVLALILKLKQLGPIGDQMIEIIDPSEKDQEDPEAMKQQRDQAAQMVQAMGEQLNALIQEREGKKAELESRERVAQLQVEVEKLKIEADLEKTRAKTMVDNESRLEIQRLQSQTRLAVAEINTQAQELSERMALISDLFKEYGIQQHKIDMEGRKQAHEAGLAAQQRLLAGEMADRKAADAAQKAP